MEIKYVNQKKITFKYKLEDDMHEFRVTARRIPVEFTYVNQ